MHIDVYFHDLSAELQARVLEAHGVDSPSEMNWDVVPITVIGIPDPEEV